MHRIRLFIMCELQVVRQGLAAIFVSDSNFEIVGESAPDPESILKAQKIQPDVILCQVKSNAEGMEMLKLLKDSCPYTKLFIFNDTEAGDDARAALALGVDGYLTRTMLPCHLVGAVELACRAGVLCLPGSLKKLVSAFGNIRELVINHRDNEDQPGINGDESNGELQSKYHLTARELEIYRLIIQNYSNKGIGKKLFISQPTVKSHVSSILRKMGLTSRTQLVLYEMQQKGMISENKSV